MPELVPGMGQVLLWLALGLLVLLCGLSFAVLRRLSSLWIRGENLCRQKTDGLAEHVRQLAEDAKDHRTDLSRYGQAAIEASLRELERAEMARMDALGLRLDRSLSVQEERFRHLSATVLQELSLSGEKTQQLRESLLKAFEELRMETGARLEQTRATVDEYLHGALGRRLGESFALVNERLEQVYLGLGEMKTLASGVGDLKRVLTNVKTRGVWGEMQLEALLMETLTPGQFERNAAVREGSQERVEFALILPGRAEGDRLLLPIDAKFPVEAYEKLLAALDTGEKQAAEEARAALASAISREASRIASKYIAPPATTDFAVMYLPIEGLYAEVLRVPGLVESLQRQNRVVVSGPTTLSALLNSLQMGFRTLAIERRSGEVWRLLGSVKAEFTSFAGILEKTQARLRQASDSIELAAKKTRTIEGRLRGVEVLEAHDEPGLPAQGSPAGTLGPPDRDEG